MANQRYILLGSAFLLTVASGFLHGYMTQRWGIDKRMSNAATRLTSFSQPSGVWQLQEEKLLSDSALKMLQCAGYINHVYKHQDTGRQISVTVMVGPGSTMSIHRPEICYESRNFSLVSKQAVDVADANERSHAFWAVDFVTNDINRQNLRVYYGWSNGGAWSAPNRPRLAFAGERVLYKIQIAEVDPVSDQDRVDSTLHFMNEFLPMLQGCI